MGLFCHLLYNKFPFNSNNNNNKVSIQLLLKKNKNVSIQQKWKRVIKSDSEILRLIIYLFFFYEKYLFHPSILAKFLILSSSFYNFILVLIFLNLLIF